MSHYSKGEKLFYASVLIMLFGFAFGIKTRGYLSFFGFIMFLFGTMYTFMALVKIKLELRKSEKDEQDAN
jgi:hypothetical protein